MNIDFKETVWYSVEIDDSVPQEIQKEVYDGVINNTFKTSTDLIHFVQSKIPKYINKKGYLYITKENYKRKNLIEPTVIIYQNNEIIWDNSLRKLRE